MKKVYLLLFILILFSLQLVGCQNMNRKVTIGMVPARNPVEMVKDFKLIKEYLEKEMGVKINVMVAKDYSGLITGMRQKKIDIGFYGPFSYIAADSELKLEPMVMPYRYKVGASYRSLIISNKDSNIKTIEDLKGKKIAFVDPGSTSGFVIPYALFKSRDIDIKNYFSNVVYVGSHDSVALKVNDKSVDAGAIEDLTFSRMIDTGKIKKDNINVIWESEPLSSSPFIARADLDNKLKTKFKAAMLSINKKAPKALISYDKSIEKYVGFDSNSYNIIRNTARILGKNFINENFLKKK